LHCTTPAERTAYLEQACSGNEALRQKLTGLLQAHDNLGEFLKQPILDRSPHESEAASMVGETKLIIQEFVGQNIGPYKLLEKLGEGGMGTVWIAERNHPKQLVALKLIKPGMDSRAVLHRFEAERQALALMNHHNIAKFLDAGISPLSLPGR